MSSRQSRTPKSHEPPKYNQAQPDLLDIYKHAVDAVKPDKLMRNSVKFQWDEKSESHCMWVGNHFVNLASKSLHVIGGGKCVLGMAESLFNIAKVASVTSYFGRGLISVPVELVSTYKKPVNTLFAETKTMCMFGARDNMPDEDSYLATRKMFETIRDICLDDEESGLQPVFIVLLSGGGSACLTYPKNVTLDQKRAVIRDLMKSGADITEINKARTCLSHVKGGQLTSWIQRHCPSAIILGLIISDVVGNKLEYIAGGPTVLPEIDAEGNGLMGILKKHKIMLPTVSSVRPSETSDTKSAIHNIIIGDNTTALKAASAHAIKLGYEIISMGSKLEGQTIEIVDLMREQMASCPLDKRVLVMGAGESTVKMPIAPQPGRGGRCQHMALDYLRRMRDEIVKANKLQPVQHHCPGCQCKKYHDGFLSGSTDGQDGPTCYSGCYASYHETDQDFWEKHSDLLDTAHTNCASTNFWESAKKNWLIKTGPTGTNVMDLYLFSRSPLDSQTTGNKG